MIQRILQFLGFKEPAAPKMKPAAYVYLDKKTWIFASTVTHGRLRHPQLPSFRREVPIKALEVGSLVEHCIAASVIDVDSETFANRLQGFFEFAKLGSYDQLEKSYFHISISKIGDNEVEIMAFEKKGDDGGYYSERPPQRTEFRIDGVGEIILHQSQILLASG